MEKQADKKSLRQTVAGEFNSFISSSNATDFISIF
jgi:hypothetical protein